MAFDSSDLAGLANLAARALQHQVRQTTSSAISAATSLSSSTTPDPTSPASAIPTSTSDSALVPTSTGDSGSGSGSGSNNGSGSSPLLFFVALGFGVVFTNLWIIVGVKYCFRYNARNRSMRMTGEDGEPITLENMPAHPRRRRREKKLMSIDEVNEKFPMMKYKSWVAGRAQDGLPTRGGISQPPSRAPSVREADGIIPMNKERESIEDRPATSGASITRLPTQDEPIAEHAEKTAIATTANDDAHATTSPAHDRTASPDSEDEQEAEDRIHDAIPPEALESSGDTCAICIDTLEDDDDVRGLTCGHAFHAVCLDPWLTSRRACCPLCKADYYTPKPRPQQPEGAHGPEVGPTVSINPDPRTNRMNMPSRPGVVWVFHPRRGRFPLPTFRSRTDGPNQATRSPRRTTHTGFISRAATASHTTRTAPEAAENNPGSGFLSSIRLPRFNLPGRFGQQSTNTNNEVTPSNLEAGTRTEAAR